MSWVFNIALIIAAILYASVGHGGASSYLAIFALSGNIAPEEMRSAALILNMCVSAVSFFAFRSQHHFDSRTFGILIITSVPAAFLGGMLKLSGDVYQMLLGIFLLIAVLKMIGVFGHSDVEPRRMKVVVGLICGAVLGFISGVLGIGGGIILSPLLLLFGWAPMKTTAGVSAAFIFVNSAAGLSGLYSGNQLHIHADLPWWVVFVFAGGVVGAVSGSQLLATRQIRWILAAVLSAASVKLLLL